MAVQKVQIEGGPVGLDSIVVDGQDVTKQVSAMTLVSGGPHELTEIHLTSPVEVGLDIEGAVYVRDETNNASLLASLAEWLRTRDAEEIEELALKSYGMEDDQTMTQKVLEILANMAGEASVATE